MAQTANYVHVTRELHEIRHLHEVKLDGVMMATSTFDGNREPLSEKEKLVFGQTENGSVDFVET